MEKAVKRYAPIFVLPTFLAFVIGFILPFIEGLYLSFCQFTTVKDAKFIGIFFMPNLIGGIVLGYIWQILINCVLSIVGKPLLALNTSAGYWGLIILMCWQQIGYMMIIYIAGLQNVSDDLIEAAQIDGATWSKTLWKVKLPMVMPSITICVFLTLTNSFKLFDQNLALTGGDPNHFTEMLALNIYQTFYARAGAQWKGLGQAKAVLFCVLVIAISMIQLKATRSREVQQ